MVMARGVEPCVDVHTTTGFVRRRITERSFSGSDVSASGSAVGGEGGETWNEGWWLSDRTAAAG